MEYNKKGTWEVARWVHSVHPGPVRGLPSPVPWEFDNALLNDLAPPSSDADNHIYRLIVLEAKRHFPIGPLQGLILA